MAKNILQDIQPLSRKNIPNMDSEAKPVAVEKVIHFNEEENDRYEHHQNGPHHKRNIILWSLAGVSIMVFLIAMSALYSRASVSVIPKSEKPAFDSTFTAARDAGGSADFAFQVKSRPKRQGRLSSIMRPALRRNLLPRRGLRPLTARFSAFPRPSLFLLQACKAANQFPVPSKSVLLQMLPVPTTI